MAYETDKASPVRGGADEIATSDKEERLASPREYSRDDLSPYPILCISRREPQRVIVPAVRCFHPLRKWGIFPVSKEELGDVWDTQESMAPWIEHPLPNRWERAEDEFSRFIEYPIEILSALLRVLRTQMFDDGVPVSWSRWSFSCKNDVDKIGIHKICAICKTARTFSPRVIYFSPPDLSTCCLCGHWISMSAYAKSVEASRIPRHTVRNSNRHGGRNNKPRRRTRNTG